MGTSTYRAVLVDTVDLSLRVGHCTDQTNAAVDATWRAIDAAFQIPAPGDIWTIYQSGWDWIFDRRLDTPSDQAFMQGSMQPGDTRLLAQGTLFIQSPKVAINGEYGAPGQAPVVQSDGSLAYATVSSGGGGGATLPAVSAVNANYLIQTTDDILVVDSSGGSPTLSLPSNQPTGTIYEVKDGNGSALGHPVFVNAADGATIDGSSTYAIRSPYQGNRFVSYVAGTSWIVL